MAMTDAFSISANTFVKSNAPKRMENLFTGMKPTAFARSGMGLMAGGAIAARSAISEAKTNVGKKIPGIQNAPAMGWDTRNATTGSGALARALGGMNSAR